MGLLDPWRRPRWAGRRRAAAADRPHPGRHRPRRRHPDRLDGQQVTYPVFIDPDLNRGQNAFWYTDRAYPAQSYLNGNQADGVQRVGNGGGYLSHAFWQFDVSGLAGKKIQGATFNTGLVWSNSCTGKDIRAYRFGPQGAGFTWNTEQNLWYELADTRNIGCTTGAVGFSAVVAANWASSTGSSTVQIGLRAADENDALTRRHFAQAASLTVSYNTPPNAPTNPAMTSPARSCATDANNPSFVNGAQAITLKVNASDADGGNVAANFYLKTVATGAEKVIQVTGLQAQGANLTTTIAANTLVDGQTYAWSAAASDYIQVSNTRSPFCYFVVDATKPALPMVQLDATGRGSARR